MSDSTAIAAPPVPFLNALRRWDLLLTLALFGIIMMLILPMPSYLLDLLLAFNIGISILVLLLITYVKDPPEFSSFPTLLLGLTLYRLALNITSTRLILIEGHAGKIIEGFGNFVIQGNYVVGAVVFLILVIINFVVITKGAGRIAEVTARFTLDALPGKQMAIDAELNAGLIDEKTATRRRIKVHKEADFYGSMDGANKFVRGDAIAGIMITIINIIAGFAIGVFQMDMTAAESLRRFTLLSIGDGLVAQIPALLVSVAAGILVTRASENTNLGTQIGRQFTRYPRAIGISAGMLGFFGLLPGMPMVPFVILASAMGFVSWTLHKQELLKGTSADDDDEQSADAGHPDAKKATGQGGATDSITPGSPVSGGLDDKIIDLDSFSVELGYGLLPLAEERRGGDLLQRITGLRRALSKEKGVLIPPISVRDNLEMDAHEYRFLLRGRSIAIGKLQPGRWLAMNVGSSSVRLKGVVTREPVFGLEAIWIGDDQKATAEVNGYTVVDGTSVLITHLSEMLRVHLHVLIGRQEIQQMIDHVKQKFPVLVTELIPDIATLGLIQRVFQNLLRENLSVQNREVILEAIADFAPLTKHPDELTELVRRRLGLYFVPAYEYTPGQLKAFTLDPRLEQLVASRVQKTPSEVGLMLDPNTARYLLDEFNRLSRDLNNQGLSPILIVGAECRLALKRFYESSLPRMVILAYQEVPATTQIENVGLVLLPANMQNRVPEPALSASK